MSEQSATTLKTYFERLDKPTEQQFVNLIDTIFGLSNGNNISKYIFVDSVNGDDATGQAGRMDKPFLTIPAANLIAANYPNEDGVPYTIYVRKGIYEQFRDNIDYSNVNQYEYYFESGARIQVSGNLFYYGSTGEKSLKIRGYGDFYGDYAFDMNADGSQGYTFVFDMECNSIQTIGGSAFLVYGDVDFKVKVYGEISMQGSTYDGILFRGPLATTTPGYPKVYLEADKITSSLQDGVTATIDFGRASDFLGTAKIKVHNGIYGSTVDDNTYYVIYCFATSATSFIDVEADIYVNNLKGGIYAAGSGAFQFKGNIYDGPQHSSVVYNKYYGAINFGSGRFSMVGNIFVSYCDAHLYAKTGSTFFDGISFNNKITQNVRCGEKLYMRNALLANDTVIDADFTTIYNIRVESVSSKCRTDGVVATGQGQTKSVIGGSAGCSLYNTIGFASDVAIDAATITVVGQAAEINSNF